MLQRAALLSLFMLAAGVVRMPPALAGQQPPTYTTEADAKKACPHDIVVWLNTKSRYYHYKGQPWYGTTDVGAFVCKAEADMAGDIPGDLPIPGQ
jgi:hypothetical protein